MEMTVKTRKSTKMSLERQSANSNIYERTLKGKTSVQESGGKGDGMDSSRNVQESNRVKLSTHQEMAGIWRKVKGPLGRHPGEFEVVDGPPEGARILSSERVACSVHAGLAPWKSSLASSSKPIGPRCGVKLGTDFDYIEHTRSS